MRSSLGEFAINICGGGGKSPREVEEGEATLSGGGGRGGDGERWLLTIAMEGGIVLSVGSDIEGGGGGKEGEGDRTGWSDGGRDDSSIWG